jgi:hypothetical protein
LNTEKQKVIFKRNIIFTKTLTMKKILTIILFGLFLINNAMAGGKSIVVRELSATELPSHNLVKFPNAINTKYVQLDLSVLDEHNLFSITLFGDTRVDFNFDRMYNYSTGSYSWVGKSKQGAGMVIFSSYQSNINGILYDDKGSKYILQQVNTSDLYILTEVSTELLNESPNGTQDYVENNAGHNKKTRANPDVCAVGNACIGSVTIDLMVLGAADAITNAGSVPAFIASVTSSVTEMNTAYTNSGGTNLTFNLVHCNSTSFVTTSDMNADLTNFAADLGVQTLRNTYYADLVGLWSGSGNYAGFCGLGYLNTNPTNYSNSAAYTVTDFSCGMTNLSFAHECGHNMGLRHDWYVDGGSTPCSHHHGYTNAMVIPSGLPTSARWRTIMAYNNECSANGFNCSRIPRWSNPSANYLSDPTGVAIGSSNSSNEIYGFERFKCVVSQFKVSPTPTPVTLISFKGSTSNYDVHLTWETANELNLLGYELEIKKGMNSEFKPTSFISSNNLKDKSTYAETLTNLQSGTYFFRLKIKDIDNSYTYSEVIKIVVSGTALQTIVYPNPAQSELTISLYNPVNQTIKISLIDMLGRDVMSIFNGTSEVGQRIIPVNVSALPKGIYVCQIIGSKDKVQTKVTIE